MQEVTGSTPVSSTTHSSLLVFEDAGTAAFGPLIALRAIFDLRCGARTLLESIEASLGAHTAPEFLVRSSVSPLVLETHGEPPQDRTRTARPLHCVNARLLALGSDLKHLFAHAPASFALFSGEHLVAARCDPSWAPWLRTQLQGRLASVASTELLREQLHRELPRVPILSLGDGDWMRDGSRLLDHVWELVQSNSRALVDQFDVGGVHEGARVDAGVHLMQSSAIRIEEGVRLRPGVVLDAENGPVTIATGTDVQPHVVVRGPAWIGPGCLLKAGAKVHPETSLGPVCKVGGEVEGCIMQGYANKQHEGYLGHAYLGEWVNLGADTNNSDLKNNYGNVRMWEAGRFVDTGRLFVGLVAADHVKTAINTQLNTGTVIELASQIAQPGFPPKYIPPFSWCTAQGIELYDWERALGTARVVMERRQRTLTPAYESALRAIYAMAASRHRHGMTKDA